MAVFREVGDALVANYEWVDYIIDASGDSVELTIRLKADKFNSIEVANDIARTVDLWFFLEMAHIDAFDDHRRGEAESFREEGENDREADGQRCEPNHLSRSEIARAFSRGWDIERPEREKIDLVKRYGDDLHPVRLDEESPDQIAFFLDCRFLSFTGRCDGGHSVNPMNAQYGPSMVKIKNREIATAYEWFDNPDEGNLSSSTSLGPKSDLWHSISLESFIEFLCHRNGLSESCKNEVKSQIQAITLKLAVD